jgi:hypothetical protein
MDGMIKGVNKRQQRRIGNTKICCKGNLQEQQKKIMVKLEEQNKRNHNKKKKEYYEQQLKWVQECDTRNDSWKFYKQMNRSQEGFQAK